jgi:predicted nucleotidyltransferase
MDRTTALTSAQRFADEVCRIMNPQAIVLFGSYAKGGATEDSDIDVAVIFNGFIGDKWAASTDLWHLINKVDDRIEPILLDTTNDPAGFADEVYRTGQVLYIA